MGISEFRSDFEFAKILDQQDDLKDFRKDFLFPKQKNGDAYNYFCGNSLGLQPIKTREYINEELSAWSELGVEAHFKAKTPWYSYHESVTQGLAEIVGAQTNEVVAMNSLTTNLHLALVSFYQPNAKRYKILIEKGAFPSDYYAVKSQIRQRGFDVETALVEITPREGEQILRTEDILASIEKHGPELACVMLGGVQYLTGQLFDMKEIASAAQKQNAYVGFDLAHAAGNVELKLHEWNVDFAVWCSYKYLNSGAGGIAGFYVHERHSQKSKNGEFLPRFEGWWGTNKTTRFKMEADIDPMLSAEAWQLSNPPIFQLAALRASLELFQKAQMSRIRKKSVKLTAYFEYLLDQMLGSDISIITPRQFDARGAQLSLRIGAQIDRSFIERLADHGVVCDFRMPDIIRAAPAPLYNNFSDVHALVSAIKAALRSS